MTPNSTIQEKTKDLLTSVSNIIWDRNLSAEQKEKKLANPIAELSNRIDAELQTTGVLLRDASDLLKNIKSAIDEGRLDKIPNPKQLSLELGKLSLIFNALLSCTQSFAIDSSELMKAIVEIFAKLRINKAEDNRAISERILVQATNVQKMADQAADMQKDAEVISAAATIVLNTLTAVTSVITIGREASSAKKQIANSKEASDLADMDITITRQKAELEQQSADLSAAKTKYATLASNPSSDKTELAKAEKDWKQAANAFNVSQHQFNRVGKENNKAKLQNKIEDINLQYESSYTRQSSSAVQAVAQTLQAGANIGAAEVRKDAAKEKNLADFREAQKSMAQNVLQSNITFVQSLSDVINQCLQLIGTMIEKYEQMIQSVSRA